MLFLKYCMPQYNVWPLDGWVLQTPHTAAHHNYLQLLSFLYSFIIDFHHRSVKVLAAGYWILTNQLSFTCCRCAQKFKVCATHETLGSDSSRPDPTPDDEIYVRFP